MSYKAVIFDMDGVLIDSEPTQLSRHKEYLAHLEVTLSEKDLLRLVGNHKKMIFEIIAQYYTGEKEYTAYFKKFLAYYKDRPIDYTKLLNEGVRELLDWLKEQGYKIAIASSGAPDKIDTVLTQCELKEYFDLVVSGDMFHQSKPHPEIYLTVADKLGVSCTECLVVEDSNYGIEAARRAEMFTMAKREERFPFSQEEANIIFDSFDEVKRFLEKQLISAINYEDEHIILN